MMLEGHATEDIIRIVISGGGLTFYAGLRATDDLVRIAMAAKRGGSRVTMQGLEGRATDDLVRIAMAGKGSVIFAPKPA